LNDAHILEQSSAPTSLELMLTYILNGAIYKQKPYILIANAVFVDAN